MRRGIGWLTTTQSESGAFPFRDASGQLAAHVRRQGNLLSFRKLLKNRILSVCGFAPFGDAPRPHTLKMRLSPEFSDKV
jgi:hypothetical protein